jgi:MFS family permease
MDQQNARVSRSIWRNQQFLLLWSGQLVSTLGTSISTFALPLLVLMLTRSPMQAGFVAAMRELPYLLLSLPAGALIDRWDRKALMIRCDLARWFVLGSVPLAFALGHLTLPQLYLVAFVEGTAYVLFSLAQISALPQVVTGEQLADAYALDQSLEFVAPLLGPSLGALIIGLTMVPEMGASLTYLVDSLSYLVSALSLFFVRASFQMPRETSEELSGKSTGLPGLVRDILEGLRFLWQEPHLRALLLLTAAVNFLQSPLDLILIVLGQNTLHLSVQMIGLIVSVSGIGGAIGSVVAPWFVRRLRSGQIVLISVVIWSLATLILALAPHPALLLPGRFLASFIWPTYGVMVVSYRLSRTPDRLQGRVNSAFRFLSFGIEPFGKVLAGLLLAPLGPQFVLGGIALGFVMSVFVVSRTALLKA